MPTAAKLLASVWFALAGWLAANAHVPALGESASVGSFRELTALIGLVCGWRVMGNSVDNSYADSVGSGLKTSIILAFMALLLFSCHQMVGEAYRMRFDGPLEAMLGWADLMIKNALLMVSVGVIGVLVIAGLVGGPLTEWAWRRWR